MAVLRSEISKAKAEGKIIIFTDECMFTTATMMKLAYSGLRTNVSIDERLRNSKLSQCWEESRQRMDSRPLS